MPTDHRLEDQLARYGTWLEDHLRTSLRPEVTLTPDPSDHGSDRRGRWYVTLVATAAVVGLVIAAIAFLSGRGPDVTTHSNPQGGALRLRWTDGTAHPSMQDQQPTSLVGGSVGYLAIRSAADDAGAAWFSADGNEWTDISSSFGGGLISSTVATTDALWVQVDVLRGFNGTPPTLLYRSTDGITWSLVTPRADVVPPLHAVGDLLVADVTDSTGQVRTSVSTDGERWTPPNGFSGRQTVISAASIGSDDFLLTDSGLWTRRAGGMWRLVERPSGSVIVAAGDTLVSIQDLLVPQCAANDAGAIQTSLGSPTDDCQKTPAVQHFGAGDTWTDVASSPRLAGAENSPTVGVDGLLVSANIDYLRELRLTVSPDGGTTWRDQGIRRPALQQTSPVTPLLATNGRTVVAMLPAMQQFSPFVVVGTPTTDPVPSTSTPSPDGSGVAFSTSTPIPTDLVQATMPFDPSNPLTSYLEFPSDRLLAGGRMQGSWVVVNNSDTPYSPQTPTRTPDVACSPSWVVYLTYKGFVQEYAQSAECRHQLVFPPGETRLAVEVVAQRLSCFTDLTGPATSGCGGESDPLPLGTYHVRLSGGNVNIPRPEPFTIEIVGRA